jgi:hypothetical protein
VNDALNWCCFAYPFLRFLEISELKQQFKDSAWIKQLNIKVKFVAIVGAVLTKYA